MSSLPGSASVQPRLDWKVGLGKTGSGVSPGSSLTCVDLQNTENDKHRLSQGIVFSSLNIVYGHLLELLRYPLISITLELNFDIKEIKFTYTMYGLK